MSEPAIKEKSPAKSTRRRARELAVQGIYQWRLAGGDGTQIEKQIREEKGMGRYDAEFFSELLRGVLRQGVIRSEGQIGDSDPAIRRDFRADVEPRGARGRMQGRRNDQGGEG